MRTWDDVWADFEGMNFWGMRLKKEQKKTIEDVLGRLLLSKDALIMDVGCGAGYCIKFFRELGYKNTYGLDPSPNAIEVCKKLFGFTRGKDVFMEDVMQYHLSHKFEMVFSEGMLEHHANMMPIVRQMAMLSNKWIFLIQPNQKSFFSRVKYAVGTKEWENEHPYSREDYINAMKRVGFHLVKSGSLNFNEEIWMLFKKGGR